MPNQAKQPDNLRDSVIDRFGMVATEPQQGRKFPVGAESAKRLGYQRGEVDGFPSSLTESFCGVGNPFLRGQPMPGQMVLDLGCGAGFDTLLAAQMVGPNGKVIGVEMTPAMIAKARNNAEIVGPMNVEIVLGDIENLPLSNDSIDLVISNGVFDLCPDKSGVLRRKGHEIG
jgi:arsenite methyltransferase